MFDAQILEPEVCVEFRFPPTLGSHAWGNRVRHCSHLEHFPPPTRVLNEKRKSSSITVLVEAITASREAEEWLPEKTVDGNNHGCHDDGGDQE